MAHSWFLDVSVTFGQCEEKNPENEPSKSSSENGHRYLDLINAVLVLTLTGEGHVQILVRPAARIASEIPIWS